MAATDSTRSPVRASDIAANFNSCHERFCPLAAILYALEDGLATEEKQFNLAAVGVAIAEDFSILASNWRQQVTDCGVVNDLGNGGDHAQG
jgi:hypothetical protein